MTKLYLASFANCFFKKEYWKKNNKGKKLLIISLPTYSHWRKDILIKGFISIGYTRDNIRFLIDGIPADFTPSAVFIDEAENTYDMLNYLFENKIDELLFIWQIRTIYAASAGAIVLSSNTDLTDILEFYNEFPDKDYHLHRHSLGFCDGHLFLPHMDDDRLAMFSEYFGRKEVTVHPINNQNVFIWKCNI